VGVRRSRRRAFCYL